MLRFALVPLALAASPLVGFAQPIELTVDVEDVARKVIHVREVIPAGTGRSARSPTSPSSE